MACLIVLTLAMSLLARSVHTGPILPDFQSLLTDAVDASYDISSRCNTKLDHSECRLTISDPDNCLTVRILLSTILPKLPLDDYRSGVASDLLDVSVSDSFVDRCKKILAVSGGTTKPMTIVPSIMTLNKFCVNVTYTLLSPFTAHFSGVWSIGDVKLDIAMNKSEHGFYLKGKAVETTGVTTSRLISGLSSYISSEKENVVRYAFHLLHLDNLTAEYVNVEAMIDHDSYGLKLSFDTNFLKSQIFVFLGSAESTSGNGTFFDHFNRTRRQVFFMGMSVRNVRLSNLMHSVIDDDVDIPVISDMLLHEAGVMYLPQTTELVNCFVPMLNIAASELEDTGGVGIAFQLKLSDESPIGTFYLGFDGDIYKFKVISDEPIHVTALLEKVIPLFSSKSITSPPQLSVTDILLGSLKTFEFNKATNAMTVTAAIGDSVILIPNIIVLEDIVATFFVPGSRADVLQLEPMRSSYPSSPRSAADFSFELESVWRFDQISVSLSVAKDTQGFLASGSVEGHIPVEELIQWFGASFLPTGAIRDALLNIGLGNFSIEDPSVEVMFGNDLSSVHIGGCVSINYWNSTVELVVGRVKNDLVMAAAVTLSRIGIVSVVKDLTGGALDISLIPGSSILSNTAVAFAVSPRKMPKGLYLTMSSPLLAGINIAEGINFAASLTLPANCGRDSACKVVKQLLGADIELKLLATLTSTNDLSIKAVVGTPVTLAKDLVMEDVGFVIDVGRTRNVVAITGSLKFINPPIVLTGEIGLSIVGGFLGMSMDGMWNRAFGLDYLAIGDINFQLTITPGPTVISSLELGGRAIIGYQNNPSATPIEVSAYIGVDQLHPRNNYFRGSISALTVPAILKAFGQTIPLPYFLEEIGFPNGANISFSELQRTLPNGVTIQKGFFFSGILQLLLFNVTADIKIDSKSVYANVTVTPFNIGKGLIDVFGSDEKKGPSVLVDISYAPPHAKLLIDGGVSVLGIGAYTRILMDESGTSFAIRGKLLQLFSVSLEIKASYGSLNDAEFVATGKFENDLFSELQNRLEYILDNYVKEANKAINGAKQKLDKADKACDDARKPFEKAKAEVSKAQSDFDNAVDKLRRARQSVEGEKKKFDNEVSTLEKKKAKCRFRQCNWYDLPCQAENAGYAVCQGALEVAKGAVKAAKGTLDVAKLTLKGAQDLVDNSDWTLEAAKGVLEVTKNAVHDTCDFGVDAAKGILEAAKEANKFGVKILEKTGGGLLGMVDIREMGFHVKVAVAKTGRFEGWMKVSLFGGKPETLEIKINILSIKEMAGSIVDVIKDSLDV